MNKKNICIHPWSHVNINPNGDVWPCCHQRGPEMYVLGNFKTQTIEEIFNDEPIRKIRRDMIAGKLPEEVCMKCIEYEKMNIFSPRMEANRQDYAPKVHELIAKTKPDGSIENFKIKYWDLRWSNKCNMACIMCDPDWSSLWTQNLKAHYKNMSEEIIESDGMLKHYRDKIGDDKVLHVPDMGWIDKHIHDVENIYFAGGEPLLMPEHWYILEKLDKLGRHDVKIKYNTNMSKIEHLGKKGLDYWRNWPRSLMSIEASIDETGKRAEYIRSGTIWPIVEKNIRTLVDAEVKVQPNTSIGAYNVMRLPELLDELWELFKRKDINIPLKINLNPVLNYWCRVDVLPDEWKQKTKAKLIRFQESKMPITKLDKILYELDRPHNENAAHMFFRHISFLDLNKHTTLFDALPEFQELDDMYGGNLYEKFKNEWIEKSNSKRPDSTGTDIHSSIHN